MILVLIMLKYKAAFNHRHFYMVYKLLMLSPVRGHLNRHLCKHSMNIFIPYAHEQAFLYICIPLRIKLLVNEIYFVQVLKRMSNNIPKWLY